MKRSYCYFLVLNYDFLSYSYCSAVLTKAKALLECLNNFHTGVEEVNMKFTKEEITWSSFQLGTPGA
jgi:hypothetical protein